MLLVVGPQAAQLAARLVAELAELPLVASKLSRPWLDYSNMVFRLPDQFFAPSLAAAVQHLPVAEQRPVAAEEKAAVVEEMLVQKEEESMWFRQLHDYNSMGVRLLDLFLSPTQGTSGVHRLLGAAGAAEHPEVRVAASRLSHQLHDCNNKAYHWWDQSSAPSLPAEQAGLAGRVRRLEQWHHMEKLEDLRLCPLRGRSHQVLRNLDDPAAQCTLQAGHRSPGEVRHNQLVHHNLQVVHRHRSLEVRRSLVEVLHILAVVLHNQESPEGVRIPGEAFHSLEEVCHNLEELHSLAGPHILEALLQAHPAELHIPEEAARTLGAMTALHFYRHAISYLHHLA